MCLYVPSTCVQVPTEASEPLELELPTVVGFPVWMLVTILGFPGREVDSLTSEPFFQPQ